VDLAAMVANRHGAIASVWVQKVAAMAFVYLVLSQADIVVFIRRIKEPESTLFLRGGLILGHTYGMRV
jgi:hypothetical protein